MDTRFWGPSGWRLLHLISFSDSTNKHAFFVHLPYVLPCKFCRASLADYYLVDPVPNDDNNFAKWLYRIHNRVNGKLREQKLLHVGDPSWEDVRKQYTNLLNAPCSIRNMIGWDFLFSIAYTTPCPAVTSSPMPGAPPITSLTSPELRNRWGVMTRSERLPYIHSWWKALPRVLPFKLWRDTWLKVIPTVPNPAKGRNTVTTWLYKAEQAMCKSLHEASVHDSFTGLCTKLNTFSSECGKNRKRAVTCRAKRKHILKTLKQRRN